MSTRQSLDVPGTYDMQAHIEPTAAADASKTHVVFLAPAAVKLEKVKVIPGAAVTGANTNTKHLNLINRGTNGAGAAEIANRDLVLGTDIGVAGVDLYAPASPLELAQGAQIGLQIEQIGTGQALPPLAVVVEFSPN
ncbi:MAG: hypothetical protein HY618_00925 [Candidatus Tectomicrobia bacterium]|uniref:Uncharacterized protein n=1 Tax=Tectimicrobiota bacterium TaxID=2528274 RepID=A0A932ZVJ3_UNCTE|nr:hypothetical protein [Candidatus Tectomicrobia bacterium]